MDQRKRAASPARDMDDCLCKKMLSVHASTYVPFHVQEEDRKMLHDCTESLWTNSEFCSLLNINERLTEELLSTTQRNHALETLTKHVTACYFRDKSQICELRLRLKKEENEEFDTMCTEEYEVMNKLVEKAVNTKAKEFTRMDAFTTDMIDINRNLADDLKKFRFIFKNSEKCVTCQNKVHRYDLQKYIEAVSTSKAYTTNVTKQNDLDDLHDKLENAEAKIKLLQLQLRNKEKLCESLRRTQVVKKEAALTKKEALAEENTALTSVVRIKQEHGETSGTSSFEGDETDRLATKIYRLKLDLNSVRRSAENDRDRYSLERTEFKNAFRRINTVMEYLEKRSGLPVDQQFEINRNLTIIKRNLAKYNIFD